MGKAVWGTSGGFQGKNGANIGRWRNGDNIVGPLPHPSLVPPTTALINVRTKFSLVSTFLGWISPLIKIGFRDERVGNQSAMNVAFSYNYRNALTGVAPSFAIDYPEVRFSQGKLGYPYNPGLATTEDAQLDLTWDATISGFYGGPTDLATILVYNPAKQMFVTRIGAAVRSVLSYDLALPVNFSGDMVHVYMSFVSADGEMVSDSIYVGGTVVQ
ncbi:MAG: DUF6266 family protein [Bacteroidota bacterium]